MLIKRTSVFDGIEREMEIGVTEEQLQTWRNGALIQIAMPNLTPSEREFIMTGATDEQWDEAFKEEG